jgi:cytoskeletal protein CcmA (bactofilin family)
MAEKNNGNNGAGKGLHTVIGTGTVIEGTLKVYHDIRVDGIIKGKIYIEGDLIVGNSGSIEADIEVISTKVGGKIVGNLSARERIELEENASVMGDIKTKDLIINEGAVFHGNCSMVADAKPSK